MDGNEPPYSFAWVRGFLPPTQMQQVMVIVAANLLFVVAIIGAFLLISCINLYNILTI